MGDNRLLITDPTNGLLSRGSQVRALPGAPVLARLRELCGVVTISGVTVRRNDRSHRTDD